jgi:hypothetical protein
MAVFAPIIGLIFFMGVYPKPFLSRMEPAVNKFINEVKAKQSTLNRDQEQRGFIDLGLEEGSIDATVHAEGDMHDNDRVDDGLDQDITNEDTDNEVSRHEVSSRQSGTGGGAR